MSTLSSVGLHSHIEWPFRPKADVFLWREFACRTVDLLGTRFTMEETCYRGRQQTRHGLAVLSPDALDRDIVHRIMFDEFCLGQVHGESRHDYRRIIAKLAERSAQAIILGCTEISLLVNQLDADVPLFDTAHFYARGTAARA